MKILSQLFSIAYFCATAALMTGCSLLLDWDENNQFCSTPDMVCKADGYSCLGDRCVRDQSIPTGSTCSLDGQCEKGNYCVRGPTLCPGNTTCTEEPQLVCRKICDVKHAYQDSADCPIGFYCRPSPDPANSQQLRGACVESDCDEQNLGRCSSRQTCVMVREQAGVCFTPCEASFNSETGFVSDTCPKAPAIENCQPVGLPSAERLVCISQSTLPSQKANSCDFANHTCSAALACIFGTCIEMCDPSSGAPCHTNCVAVSSSATPYNTCSP